MTCRIYDPPAGQQLLPNPLIVKEDTVERSKKYHMGGVFPLERRQHFKVMKKKDTWYFDMCASPGPYPP